MHEEDLNEELKSLNRRIAILTGEFTHLTHGVNLDAPQDGDDRITIRTRRNYQRAKREENEARRPQIHQEGPAEDNQYLVDHNHVVINYNRVREMKLAIAKGVPKPVFNHLINFWMSRLPRFADMILFCQYLQYHLEQYSGELHPKVYQQIIQAVVAREPSFEPHFALASNIPMMCRLKFLCFNEGTPHIIYINPEVLKIQVYPLANGLPSQLMYCFTKQKQWKISELRETFIDDRRDKDTHEIYKQLCCFINDRPDLVILETIGKNRISFPHMMLRLNDHISPKLLCFGYDLKDVSMYERLHLRNDCIKSLKQFIRKSR